MTNRIFIRRDAGLPFSDAVLVQNDTLYISGRIGLMPGTKQVPEQCEEEARLLLQDVEQVLLLAGMSLRDVVSLQIFCTDLSLWDRFNSVYCEFFSKSMPARAFIGCSSLLFGARFELQGIAVRDVPASK